MSQSIIWVGWNNTPGHDKICGYFTRPDGDVARYYTFRGDRGNKDIMFGPCMYLWWSAAHLQIKKSRNGYTKITHAKLTEIWPNIDTILEEKLLVEILKGTIR